MSQSRTVIELLSQIGAADDERLLVVSVGAKLCDEEVNAARGRFPKLSSVSNLTRLEDLPTSASKPTLALVVLSSRDGLTKLPTHLLGRLRDSGAMRVAVSDPDAMLTAAELLALGYIATQGALDRVFLHDPTEYFSTRDWNNAQDWANPENFNRYRW